MQKRHVLLSQKINEEIRRIERLVIWHPNILFYNTAKYSTMRMPLDYGIRFGHLDTLRYLHMPYEFLFTVRVNDKWLKDFEKAAALHEAYCGILFE